MNEIFYILFLEGTKSVQSGVYLTLARHLHSDQPYFKCSAFQLLEKEIKGKGVGNDF